MLRPALIALSFAVAFWLGYFARGSSRTASIQPPPPPPMQAPTVASEPTRVIEKVEFKKEETKTVEPEPAPKEPTVIKTESPETTLNRAIAEPPGIDRLFLWQTALAGVTTENWRRMFDIVSKARHQLQITVDEEQAMLHRIGAIAGMAAVERFKPKDPVNDAETHTGRHAMRAWAERDRAAAWAYIEAQPKGRFRDGMIWGYALGVAPRDPHSGLEALQMLAPNVQEDFLKRVMERDQILFYSQLIESWLEAGPRNAIQPDGQNRDLRESVFRELVVTQTHFGWGDPEGQRFVSWIEQFRGAPFATDKSLVPAVQHLMNKRSVDETMNWLESYTHDSPAIAQSAATEVMQRWATKDAAGAKQWLEGHRDVPIYDFALASFLKAQRSLSREEVLALLDTFQNSDNTKLLPRNIDALTWRR
ncbi:hypothetical protein ACXR0O_01320 [Verrucomicrobiota bacterium sgz303538]